jgi:hypothetical protein
MRFTVRGGRFTDRPAQPCHPFFVSRPGLLPDLPAGVRPDQLRECHPLPLPRVVASLLFHRLRDSALETERLLTRLECPIYQLAASITGTYIPSHTVMVQPHPPAGMHAGQGVGSHAGREPTAHPWPVDNVYPGWVYFPSLTSGYSLWITSAGERKPLWE